VVRQDRDVPQCWFVPVLPAACVRPRPPRHAGEAGEAQRGPTRDAMVEAVAAQLNVRLLSHSDSEGFYVPVEFDKRIVDVNDRGSQVVCSAPRNACSRSGSRSRPPSGFRSTAACSPTRRQRSWRPRMTQRTAVPQADGVADAVRKRACVAGLGNSCIRSPVLPALEASDFDLRPELVKSSSWNSHGLDSSAPISSSPSRRSRHRRGTISSSRRRRSIRPLSAGPAWNSGTFATGLGLEERHWIVGRSPAARR